MSIKTSLIKNTSFNLASYTYLLIASFFSISILLANLGRDLFGIYLFLASFIPLASVFDFGVSTAVVRRLSLPDLERKEKISTWKTSFSMFIGLGAITALVIFGVLTYLTKTLPLFSSLDPNILNWSVIILSVTVFFNNLNSHFLSLPQAEQRFDIFNSKTLLVGSANTIFSAYLSTIYPNIAYLFLLQLVFHILTLIFMASYSLRTFKGENLLPLYNRREGRSLLGFGIKNFVGTLAGQVEAQFSKYALGIMVSAQAITSYSIPQSIVIKGAGVVSQVAQVFFPFSTSLLKKDRVKKLGKTVLVVQLLTLMAGAVAITLSFTVGRQFLFWWLKDAVVVEAAFPVLKILTFYFALTALTPIPTVLLQSLNKPHIPSIFAVLTVITEITLMFILVPIYQVRGAAFATLIGSCVTVPPFLILTWSIFRKEVARLQAS